jgi:hypothetical protein
MAGMKAYVYVICIPKGFGFNHEQARPATYPK